MFGKGANSLRSIHNAKSILNVNGNKQFVIIAANPSEPADIYEDPRVNLARATNFAELSKLRESLGSNSAINIVYMQQDKDPIQSGELFPYSNYLIILLPVQSNNYFDSVEL